MLPPPLAGHHEARRVVDAALAAGRLPHALLLAGAPQLGKRLFADWLALALLSGRPALGQADEGVARLVTAGSHPDLRVLQPVDGAREIRIDAVRETRAALHNTPALAPCRVLLIDSADDLNPASANALLKELEEPAGPTVFLLVVHAPHRLLPTIRSRCRQLAFRPLPPAEMAELAQHALADLAPAGRAARLTAAAGQPGRLLAPDTEAAESLLEALDAVEQRRESPLDFARRFQTAGARDAFAALCRLAPERLAERARSQPRALAAWEEVAPLAWRAVPQGLDPVPVALALGRALAGDAVA